MKSGSLGEKRVFVELFSGSGVLSSALRRRGHAVVSLDIKDNPAFDLLKPAVFDEIKGWIMSGLVWGLWSGTPGETFSQARRATPGSAFPGPLRSSDEPRGLQNLHGEELSQVNKANLLADRAAVLLRLAESLRLVVGEENPASSLLWWTRQRRDWASRDAHDFVIDYCAFGRPFRARTRLRLSNVAKTEEFRACRCTGRGICSFSGRTHCRLSGSENGVSKTSSRTAYPLVLCKRLARLFSTSMLNCATATRWRRFMG